MKPRRFSIAAMMGIVLAVGIGLAGLAKPSLAWSVASLAMIIGFFLTATVGAILAKRKPFWIGAAVFGWGFPIFWTVFSIFSNVDYPMSLALEAAYPALHPEALIAEQATEPSSIPSPMVPVSPPKDWRLSEDFDRFKAVGHSLGCLVIALIGGLVGNWFAAQREKSP